MTVASLKIGRRDFVVIPRREFERLQAQARQAAEDREDVAEAVKRLNNPRRKTVSLARLKSELGL
jgi:hypothetical protein